MRGAELRKREEDEYGREFAEARTHEFPLSLDRVTVMRGSESCKKKRVANRRIEERFIAKRDGAEYLHYASRRVHRK